MTYTKEKYEKQMQFINKIKNKEHKEKMLVAFLNYPQKMYVFIHIMEDMILKNTWKKDFTSQLLDNPEMFIKMVNYNKDTGNIELTTDNIQEGKYNLISN